MNEVTPIDKKAPITFGWVYFAFCIWIWNLRICYSDEDILLAFIDILSYFCWPRITPDLVRAFDFVVDAVFFVANAMVFGFTTLESSWESFLPNSSSIGIGRFCSAR